MLPLCTRVTHQGHRLAIVVDRVLDGLADEPLRAFDRHGLDADGGSLGKADLLHAHFLLQEGDDLLHRVGAGLPLDAGIDVLGVLAEDHHVDLLGFLDRAGHAGEVAHRAQAHVEIEHLAQRDVERADAARSRGGERTLDRDDVVLHRLHGLVGQPLVAAVDLDRLLAGVDLHPGDAALAAVGLGHGRVDDLLHRRGDVDAGAVALDEGDDRRVRHVQAVVGVDGDLLALGGNLDVCAHDVSKR